MFANDIAMVSAQLVENLSWFKELDDPRTRVMLNLCFNMGWHMLGTFHQFLAFMASGDYNGAAHDLESTAWYGEVGKRGPQMTALLRSGINAA